MTTVSVDLGRVVRAGGGSPVRVRLMGEEVHAVTEAEVVGRVLAGLEAGRGGWVATHNLDHLRRLKRDRDFAALCSTADLRTADGAPLVWAARLRGTPLPGRVAGSDLTLSLTEAAARAGRSIYLLGGTPGTADRAAETLRARFPGLRVAGTDCPEPGFDRDPDRLAGVCGKLALARPDITYVALGSPKQERLIRHLLSAHPGGWYLGVGISLSFITGEVRRAPAWMRRAGLEWTHRLCQEPGRLARRYLVEGIPFAARLLVASVWERVTHRDKADGLARSGRAEGV